MLFQGDCIIVTSALLNLNFYNEFRVKTVMLHHQLSLPLTLQKRKYLLKGCVYFQPVHSLPSLETELLKYYTLKSNI